MKTTPRRSHLIALALAVCVFCAPLLAPTTVHAQPLLWDPAPCLASEAEGADFGDLGVTVSKSVFGFWPLSTTVWHYVTIEAGDVSFVFYGNPNPDKGDEPDNYWALECGDDSDTLTYRWTTVMLTIWSMDTEDPAWSDAVAALAQALQSEIKATKKASADGK